MPVRRFAIALVLLAVAGCGGEDARQPAHSTPAPVPSAPPGPLTDNAIRLQLRLPARVPLRATGRARPADVRVVRLWLDRLRSGDVAGAARLFAVPSRFQNNAFVARIRSRRDARRINASLPCGARLVSAGGAEDFVVYRARLTDRPGGGCGTGEGAFARGAIRVRDRHIVEWYRLPDVDAGGPGRPAPQPETDANAPVI